MASSRALLLVWVVCALVVPSLQRGVLFADEVHPNTATHALLRTLSSEHQEAGELDFGDTFVSDPDGVHAAAPGAFDITAASFDAHGNTGARLSGGSLAVSAPFAFVSAEHPLYDFTSSFTASIEDDGSDLGSEGFILVGSGHDVVMHGDRTTVEGVFGVFLNAPGGAAHIEAADVVSAITDELKVTASNDVHFASSAADLFIDAENDVSYNAVNVDLNAHTFSQYTSRSSLTMQATSAVQAFSGTALINAIEDISLNSNLQSVSVTAATTFDIVAGDGGVVIDAPSVVFSATEDALSHVEITGGVDVVLSGETYVSIASEVDLDVQGDLEFLVNELSFSADFELSLGSLSTQDGVTLDADGDLVLDAVRHLIVDMEESIALSPSVSLTFDSEGDQYFTAGRSVHIDTALPHFEADYFLVEAIGSGSVVNAFVSAPTSVNLTASAVNFEARLITSSPDAFEVTTGTAEFSTGRFSLSSTAETVFSASSDTSFSANRDLRIDVESPQFEAADIVLTSVGPLLIDGIAHTVTAGQLVEIESGGNATFSAADVTVSGYSDINVVAHREMRIANSDVRMDTNSFTLSAAKDVYVQAVAGELDFAAGNTDIEAVTGSVLFVGGDTTRDGTNEHFSINLANAYTLTSGSMYWSTAEVADSDISIHGNSVPVTAGGSISIDGSEGILFGVSPDTTPDLLTFDASTSWTFRGDQHVTVDVTGAGEITAGDTHRTYADGVLSVSGLDSLFTAEDATITAKQAGSFSVTNDLDYEARNSASLIGGSAFLYAGNTITTTTSSLTFEATTPGSTVFGFYDQLTWTTDDWNAAISNNVAFSTSLGGLLDIDAPTLLEVEASSNITTSGEVVTIDALNTFYIKATDGVWFDGSGYKNGQSEILAPQEEIRILSSESAVLISDGDMALEADFTLQGFSDVVTLEGVDHATIRGYGVDIEAFDTVEGNVAITSGGAVSMTARTGDIEFRSAWDILVDTGDSLTLRATQDDFNIVSPGSNEANIRFEAAGTLDLEGNLGVKLLVTGEDADVTFSIADSFTTFADEGGVSLRSEGIVQGANAGGRVVDEPGVLLDAYDNGGSVFIQSDRAQTVFDGFEGLTFEVLNGFGEVDGLYGIDVKTGGDLTLEATKGFFEANGGRGLTVKAGQEPDTGAVSFTSVKKATFVSEDRISIRSEGIVDEYGIVVSSNAGDIRFATSNGKDIQSDANFDMSFTAGGEFIGESTLDVDILTYSGPTDILGTDGVSVSSDGGPIVFDTNSGTGGEVLLLSDEGGASFTSGGRSRVEAHTSITIESDGDFDIAVGEGRLDVAAESTESQIAFLAGGSLIIDSSDEEAGVTFESANNMELTAENLVAINTIDDFTIGQQTRPLVRINAGGSAVSEGFSVQSEGLVQASSQRLFNIEALQDVDLDGDSGFWVSADGPMQLKSAAGDIKWAAQRGAVNFTSAQRASVQGEQSIDVKTSGKFHLTQQGIASGDAVEVDGFRVLFSSSTADVVADNFVVDVEERATMQIDGEAVFENTRSDHGSIFVRSSEDFNGFASGTTRFLTQNDKGPIVFESVGAASSLTLETLQANSHITFVSEGETHAEGNSVSFTAFESASSGIFIEALAPPVLENDETADVEIRGSGDGRVSSSGRVEIAAEKDVFIDTTSVKEDGVGGPMLFDSGRHIEIDVYHELEFNTYAESGADIQLYAFDDLLFSSSLGNGGSLSFSGAENTWFRAAKEFTIDVDDTLHGEVADVATFVAHGKVSGFDDETVSMINHNEITFESPLGSVTVEAFNDLTVTSQTIRADAAYEASISTTVGDVTINSGNDLTLSSGDGDIHFSSANNAEITGVTSFDVTASGREENLLWGVNVHSDNSIDFEFSDSMTWTANEAIGVRAQDLSVSAVEGVFTAVNGDLVIESQGSTTLTAADFSSTSEIAMVSSAGSISVEGLSSNEITAGSAYLRTPADAAGANVAAFAAGSTVIGATEIRFEASGPEGADGLIHASGGRMRFEGTDANTAILVVAEEGDLQLHSAGTRGVHVQADNDAIHMRGNGVYSVVAEATEQNQRNGVEFITGAFAATNDEHEMSFSGRDVMISGDSMTFASSGEIREGGMSIVSSGDTFIQGENLQLRAGLDRLTIPGGKVIIRATAPEIDGLGNTGIQFFSDGVTRTTRRTDISTGSRFLIPFTDTQIVEGSPCAVPRQLLYSVGEGTTSNLCFCTEYQAFSTTLRATPVWECVDFPLFP